MIYIIILNLSRITKFYLLLSHTIFSIEDDDEIERDLSRAGLAQRNKNCVVQWRVNYLSCFSDTILKVNYLTYKSILENEEIKSENIIFYSHV